MTRAPDSPASRWEPSVEPLSATRISAAMPCARQVSRALATQVPTVLASSRQGMRTVSSTGADSIAAACIDAATLSAGSRRSISPPADRNEFVVVKNTTDGARERKRVLLHRQESHLRNRCADLRQIEELHVRRVAAEPGLLQRQPGPQAPQVPAIGRLDVEEPLPAGTLLAQEPARVLRVLGHAAARARPRSPSRRRRAPTRSAMRESRR